VDNHIKPCEQCQLTFGSREVALTKQGTDALVISSTNLFGRTGNFVTQASHAIVAARMCRYMLALPLEDVHEAFTLEPGYSVYDFRHSEALQPGNISIEGWAYNTTHYCREILTADAAMQAELIYRTEFSTHYTDVDHCVRRYLGLCQPGFCGSLPHELGTTLVMHIRQGDIFKENFSSIVQRYYWQPPLDYYLAALTFQKWENILVLSEPTRTRFNPVYLMMQSLHRRGLLPAPTQFMQDVPGRRWVDDLRVLVCAPHVLLSQSTLKAVVQLGWPHQVFAVECSRYLNNPRTYQIAIKGENGEVFEPTLRHTNSPLEWVQMLLHRLPDNVVTPCTP
jgi:hypothetical protein